MPRAHTSWLEPLFARRSYEVSQTVAQLEHTTADAGFDSAERLVERRGDFQLSQSPQKSHFDGLPLFQGKRGHGGADEPGLVLSEDLVGRRYPAVPCLLLHLVGDFLDETVTASQGAKAVDRSITS